MKRLAAAVTALCASVLMAVPATAATCYDTRYHYGYHYYIRKDGIAVLHYGYHGYGKGSSCTEHINYTHSSWWHT